MSRTKIWLPSWQGGIRAESLSLLVALFLVVLLGHALAQLTWMVLGPVPEAAVSARGQPVAEAWSEGRETESESVSLDKVASLHLFGEAERGEEGAQTVPVDAPDTRLRLTLKGVVATSVSGLGIALIADEKGEEKHYTEGSELPGNAVLEQVLADRVVLRRGGRYEQLRLTRDALGPEAAPRVAATSETSGTVPARLRQQWLENPADLVKLARPRAVFEDGVIKGFRISPDGNRRLFRQAGLQDGDVITGVNGRGVADIDSPSVLTEQLSGAREVRLTIERNGRSETVVLRVGE